jgi:hypothetical protein
MDDGGFIIFLKKSLEFKNQVAMNLVEARNIL